MNLTQRGFRNSFSGASFSLPARYNKRYLRTKKKQACPHFARFSTDTAKVNTWVATSYIHAKLTQNLFGKKYNLIQARIIKIDKLWFKMLQNNNAKLLR